MENQVEYLSVNKESDPELMDLVNRYASVQDLKPRTAIKRLLRKILPAEIENTKSDNGSQEKC